MGKMLLSSGALVQRRINARREKKKLHKKEVNVKKQKQPEQSVIYM